VAAYRGLCQSCCILSLWGSSGCHTGPLVAVESKGPLDRHTSWCHFANSSSLPHNKLYELGKTGLLSRLNPLKLHRLVCVCIKLILLCLFYGDVLICGFSYFCRQVTQGKEYLRKDIQ
jgi:hypothetical protein